MSVEERAAEIMRRTKSGWRQREFQKASVLFVNKRSVQTVVTRVAPWLAQVSLWVGWGFFTDVVESWAVRGPLLGLVIAMSVWLLAVPFLSVRATRWPQFRDRFWSHAEFSPKLLAILGEAVPATNRLEVAAASRRMRRTARQLRSRVRAYARRESRLLSLYGDLGGRHGEMFSRLYHGETVDSLGSERAAALTEVVEQVKSLWEEIALIAATAATLAEVEQEESGALREQRSLLAARRAAKPFASSRAMRQVRVLAESAEVRTSDLRALRRANADLRSELS